MAHLYINVESWSTRISKVVFASKKKAIANAKRWIKDWGTSVPEWQDRLEQITTYEMHDDCEIGTYTTEFEHLEKYAKVINIEIAE